jgi:pimeloyl-ACP methyl ester carboxylesterase
MTRHHVVLIPGFFAFAGLGDLRYFHGVTELLGTYLTQRGLDFDILEIDTLPTASVRYRAAKVLEAIAAVGQKDDGPIHLIGHSTGGLDARVAVTPHAALATPVDFNASERVASIVTIATPHHGAPLASIFGSVMGQPILKAMASSAVVGLERGKLPFQSLLRLGAIFARLDDWLGFRRTLIDQLYDQLWNDFTDERRDALIRFLQAVSDDRALLVQLTPDSLDLFNATTADPDHIRYGSVITCGARPSVRTAFQHRLDPYAHAFYLAYCTLWTLSSRGDPRYFPKLSPEQEQALIAGYGELPTGTDNDGMSPTLSQVWGPIIHVTRADHLDVMGQYGDSITDGVHADWLPSCSGFDRDSFAALWRDVAGFIAGPRTG